jgi:DNA-directed RNA polymerase subunit omega
MILQSTDELEEYIGNKYSLVIVAAKRARQLKEGHNPLARDTSPNALSIALREIENHQISSIAPPEEELAPAPREVIASLVAGTEFDPDEEMDIDDSDAVEDLAALLIGADDDEEEDSDSGDDGLTTDSSEDDDAEIETEADEDEDSIDPDEDTEDE